MLRDYQSSYHGEITFAQAFAKSCNTTFARLGMEIGYSRPVSYTHLDVYKRQLVGGAG